jgi:hypothetical protein
MARRPGSAGGWGAGAAGAGRGRKRSQHFVERRRWWWWRRWRRRVRYAVGCACDGGARGCGRRVCGHGVFAPCMKPCVLVDALRVSRSLLERAVGRRGAPLCCAWQLVCAVCRFHASVSCCAVCAGSTTRGVRWSDLSPGYPTPGSQQGYRPVPSTDAQLQQQQRQQQQAAEQQQQLMGRLALAAVSRPPATAVPPAASAGGVDGVAAISRPTMGGAQLPPRYALRRALGRAACPA